MDWHVPLLVIAAALAAVAAFIFWRARRQQRVVEHRIAIVGAREAAFIGILQRLSTARRLEDILLETVHAIERIIPDCIGTIQLIEDGKMSSADAIPMLERLRYSWRGDALEFDILARLGLMAASRRRHAIACVRQHEVLAGGLARYGYFTAARP